MKSRSVSTRSALGPGSVAGLAITPFAILFSFWIPTIALIFSTIVAVGGSWTSEEARPAAGVESRC